MTHPEQLVATPLASQGITKVYAVQHAQIASLLTDPVGGAATFGEWFDIPGIKSFEIAGDMQGLQSGLDDLLPQLQAKVQQVIDLVKKGGEAAGSVSVGGQQVDYNVKASAQGISGTASVGGQQVSGSYDAASGKASLSGFGKNVTIDARSFGTQLKPQDVADAIKWASKIGGLVAA